MTKILYSVILLLVALSVSIPARAQLVVVDPLNLAENILIELNSVEQIANQVTQIENEIQMLENEAKNLENLNFSDLNRLLALLATTQTLLDQAQGMTLSLATTEQQLLGIYPQAYNPAVSLARLDADQYARWVNSHAALSTSMQVQAQAKQNIPQDQGVLTDLMSKSSAAVGALEAIQATNELLGLQTRQLMQSQQLQLSQGRATALEQDRAVEAEARSRIIRADFQTPVTAYTPQPISLQ